MDNKKQTIYSAEYDALVPYNGETRTQIEYLTDIVMGKKSPKSYVGMISFKEPSLDETKSLIFSDYKAQAYVDAVGKEDAKEVIKAEEEGNSIFPSSNEGKSKAFDQPYEQEDYSDRYNTQLSDEEETEYQKWAEENGKAKDVFDYDMRGFWKEMKSGTASMDERGHASDKYKKPNHPTFSNESIYASEGLPGEWKKNKYGNWVFHAPKNIGKGQQAWLSEYFKNNEKGVGLAFENDIVMEETNPAKREWLKYIENYVLSHNAPKKKNNWLKTSAKGFMSAGVNIFSSIDKGFTMMGSDFGVWFAELVTGDKLPAPFKEATYRELADSIQNLDEKTWGGLRKITAKTEQDSAFAYNLSAGGGSLGLSWLGGLATKSAMFSATLFGASEAGDIYTYAREQGVSPFKAFGYASGGGVGTAALEKWGVQDFFDKYTIRNLKAFGGKIVVKQMGTEYTQEFSQSTLSNVIRMAISGEGDWREIFAQASEEGFYGAVVSPAVGGVHLAVTGKLRKKWSKVFQDRGMNKDDADRLATGLILDRDEAIKHAKEMIDDEAITQAMMSPEEKSVVLKEGEDLLAKLLDQKALGLSDESQAIVDENAQKIKERAIAEGLSEEEAEDAAKLGSNLLKNTLSLATELGVTEEQIAEEINFDITNAEDTIEKVAYVDENGRYVGEEEISIEDERNAIQEAYREEEVASLMASGMSEDEARFRVETGREPTDFDRAIGFNYIPYQTEEFTEEENQTLEIMNNPDREQIVANMSEEERRNFTALEQSVKNKELYNQSIDLQKEMNDIDRAEFDAGVPMWDKDTININGVERAVTNSSGKKIAHSEKSLRMFYEWFGDSKVVDEQGRPLVVYHGTSAEFDTFDVKKQGKNDTGFFGRGFYFTPSERVAKYYASNKIVRPVYLKTDNPLDLSDMAYKEIHEIGIDKLKELGIYTKTAKDWIENPVEVIRNGKPVKSTTTLENYIAENNLGKKLSDNAKEKGFNGIIVKGKEYVAFSPNQIKSTSNTGTFSKSNDNIRYQFAGPSAVTAALDKLEMAKNLQKSGVDNEDIRQQTGWFMGADGKWRFEISDKDANVNANIFNNRSYVLEDVLTHDKLYEAYPELARVETSVDEDLKDTPTMAALVYSYEDRYNNPTLLPFKLKINPDALLKSRDELKSILLHEVQHMIQRLEGFATGGSPKFFRENKEAFKQAFKDMASKKYKKALYDELYSKVDEALGDEILKADEESLKASKQWMKFVFDNNGDETSSEALKLEEEYDNARENLVRALEKANLTKDDYAEIKKKARDTAGMDAFQRVRDVEYYDEYDLYKRLYGEIEARNTQTRMNMSEEERLANSPESTQGYSNDEAIVVFDDGTVMAYQTEKVDNNIRYHTQEVVEKKEPFYVKDGKVIKLKKRPNGPEIASDDAMVEAVSINGEPVPEFDTTAELRDWILENLNILGEAEIASTGQIINVAKSGVRKAVKKRGKAHHQTFAKLKEVIYNAQYVGFEENDGLSKHKNADGQDVYFSAMNLNGKKYSVRIKVDIYDDGKIANYADHTVYDIEVAPKGNATEVSTPPQSPKGATYKYSVADLKGNVNRTLYQTEAEEKNLVVTHGTTLEKLEEALRLGAMPMPSLAVTKSELATGDQYGEITFVGGYDIINPNKDKANKTFAADIYSPRREKPEYELNSDGIEYIKRQTGNVSKKGDSYWTSNIEYALNNEQDYLLKEVYLASIGKISDLDGSTYSIVWEMTDKQKDDFKKWKNKLINEYTDKKIFKGVTPSGNRKYVPYDLKNILQELKQKALRGSEEGMGGTAHALRGVWADELKNIEEIRKRKDKLVDAETYKKLDNIIWDETAKLTDLLVSEKLAEDLANDLVNPEEYMIEEALKLIKPSSNIANILAKADLRSDKKAVDAVKKYMTLLKNTPVKYFESKPARAVDFSEFEGVLIPADVEYDAVARELEEQGVKQVLRYSSKEEKNQLINRMQKVFFQIQEYEDLRSTKSVSDVKKLLRGLSPDEEVRLMFDKNKGYWFAIDAQNYVHQDMITKAFEQGLYPEFRNSYEAQQYFDENYNADDEYLVRFKAHNFIDENDLQKLLDENIPYDEYKYGYAVKNNDGSGYVLFARSLYDLADTPLKSIGRDAEIWERNPYNMTEFSKVSNQELERNGIRYMAESGGGINLEVGGGRKPIKSYKRNPLKVLGQYEPTKKMITLFKGRNPTTLIHEMGHHYLPIHLRLLEKAGKWDKLKPLYKELGISSVEQMGRDAEEKLIDMFTSYIYYNEAPNVETQSIFERAKQWMINAYNTVKNFVKPSEEVTKFFDELIAGEENAPDISHLVGKEAELSKILQGARHGQELTINGLSMKDIAILRQALHARVPRRGRSLADVIRKAGGIDSRSEIAKALGYDSRKGGEMGFWNYRGTIDNEQALIELLVAEGFLFDVEQDSAEGVQAVWNKVEQLINNRDTTFNEAEQMQNEKREQAYKVQEMVNNILVKHYNKDIKTLEEDMKAVTKKLADIGAVAVDKATLEYLQNSLAKMSKDYRKLLSEKKEKQYKYQEELTKFIKSSPLNNKDKLKLIDKIRMVKDERTFEKYLGEAKSQIEKYVEAESKRVLDDLIQKEIKSSRPRKAMAQLYNYENNKLFADLREWNKLNQDNAEAMAIKLDEVIAQSGGELSRSDKLRRMFLEYKTFGKDCSVEFMQALHDEIKAAKQAGIDAKDDADFMRSFEREQDREAVLEKIKESKADKNKFVTKVVNAYRRGISNLYSMLNSLVGKEIAEKFQFETVLEDKNIKEWKHLKATNEKARKIYGVEKDSDLMNIMADKGKPMFILYKTVSNDDPLSEELNKDYKYELSVLDLIDIYNAMKNKKTAEDYVKAYGIGQLEGLLSNLTDQDRAFADMLMEDVNSRYKAINKVYINLYGMDLKRVDNYWMSSTEHSSPFDLYNDIQMQATTPGFFKERTKGQIIPVPKNAWLKYQNHIAQGYYMTEVAEKYKELSEVFKSKRIENMIKNKFGDGVYNTLVEQINAIGLNAPTDNVDDVSKVFQSAVNNWVGAKIALNPVVFAGQLTSFTNYAVDVPVKAYLKNFAYALRHPKEAFDFMMKHNKDFLMHRYESGFNEAMSRFIKDATEASNKKFGLSPKSKFGWSNALSSLVRLGDIGSLIFGGYGQFKTLLDNGMSIEEAKEKFEFSTLRSQQSGNAASISGWQRKHGVSRLLLSFKNTPMQYTRKIMDTVISLQNGDISKVQATKTLTNYLLVQPAIWVFVRNVVKDLLGLDDEDDEYTDGILEQILVNPIEAIPVVSDFVKAGYKAVTDQYVYGVFSMPLLDDVEKSVKKMQKQEKDAFDWADIFIPYVEALTSAPVGTAKRYAQKWIED